MNSEIDMTPLIKWIASIDVFIKFRQNYLQDVPENVCTPQMEMTYDLENNWNHFLCLAPKIICMDEEIA